MIAMLSPGVTAGPAASFHWWFLPSWLGLDAPCVVLTWTWATSHASGLRLSWTAGVGLFFVVWLIYLADRLVDVARCRDWTQPTGRLRFGRDYQSLFRVCLVVSVAGIVAVLVSGLPRVVVWRAAIVALGMGCYFLAFVVPIVFRQKLPGKELCVGLFFAFGAFACLGATAESLPLLASIAAVVAYNCLIIAARDVESDRANDPGGASHWWRTMDRDLHRIGWACVVLAVVASVTAQEAFFYLSVAAAFSALAILHRYARCFSADAVRALADFALFTPIPTLFIGDLF